MMKNAIRILCLALVALMLVPALVACAPAKDPAKAEAALKEAGYTTTNDTKLAPAAYKLAELNLDAKVTGTKITKDDEGNTVIEHVSIYYFADSENAKKAMEKVEKDADEEKKEEESNWVSATRSGKIVYYGTKQAIKDAK